MFRREERVVRTLGRRFDRLWQALNSFEIALSRSDLSKRNVSDAERLHMFVHGWIFATGLLKRPETHGDPLDPSDLGNFDSGTGHGLPSGRLQNPGKIALDYGLPISLFQGAIRGGGINQNQTEIRQIMKLFSLFF